MKDIKGYEGLYAITNDGEIWSYPKRAWPGGWMKQQVYIDCKERIKPYKRYIISLVGNDGKRKTFQVHRLVAKAFIPNPENKPEVNHKDGNSMNNVVSNLEWVTHKENSSHAFMSGICKKPLTNGEVVELRKICQFHSCRKVALAYGLHPATVWDINKGNRYAEVTI